MPLVGNLPTNVVATTGRPDADQHEYWHDEIHGFVNSATKGLNRTGALAETVDRRIADTATLTAPATGVLRLVAVELKAGMTVSNITFVTGTTAYSAGDANNQWFALYSSARALLAYTADDTNTAWGASSEKTLAIAKNGAGVAATTYIVPSSGLYYLGVMVGTGAGGTQPTLLGATSLVTTLTGLAPILTGTSSGTQTYPPIATAGTITVLAGIPYAYVS